MFFIFLYQRYIYKEDPNRVNEYGISANMLAEDQQPTSTSETADENGGEKKQLTNETADGDQLEGEVKKKEGDGKSKSKKCKKDD